MSTSNTEGYIQWPRPREDDNPALTAFLKHAEELNPAPVRDDSWVDELRATWPVKYPRFAHPGDWRPSTRDAQLESVLRDYSLESEEEIKTDGLFMMKIMNYKEWLRRHMIIEAAAASMVADVLLDSERGGRRNLRLIAVTYEHPSAVARRFEQDYLGLEPLVDEEEDERFRLDDADLRIHEDGLYTRWDFEFDERHGGLLPVTALARVLKTTPEELNRRLTLDEIHQRDEDGRLIMPWNMIRTDEYLLPARPYEEDPSQVMVGPVRELTEIGSYLLEEFLRAFEAGSVAASK